MKHLFLLLTLLFITDVHAAGIKISDLDDGGTLLSTDSIPVVRSGANVKVSISDHKPITFISFATGSVATAITNTNAATTGSFLGNSANYAKIIDLTGYTECRVGHVQTIAAAASKTLKIRYRLASDGFSTTVSDYIQLGQDFEVEADEVTNTVMGSWTTLANAAKAEVVLVPIIYGDGVADPAYVSMYAECR